jgi:CRISPR/Cas system-associated exonuclease Cas4 (RecB family)
MQQKNVISASDISTYLFCPQCWLFGLTLATTMQPTNQEKKRSQIAKQKRKQWFADQETYYKLNRYMRLLYFVFFFIFLILLLLDSYFKGLVGFNFNQKLLSESDLIMILLASWAIIFIWDIFNRKSKKINQDSGLNTTPDIVSIKGSNKIPVKTFYSKKLNLTGAPDALISEKNRLIPIEIKSKALKVQDRHIMSMTAYLRLIEENTGKKPPYGILILGNNKRNIRILNTPERQEELTNLLQEMSLVLAGVKDVLAAPTHYKCKNCIYSVTCPKKL